jgi:1,4-dihydroxy-2-naphthoate octaprenyltransferase
MLSGLLLLAGYFTYHTQPGIVWFVAASVTLVSVYGQLYNQLRDFEMDKAAGLYNTAIILGENNTRRVMYLAIGFAGVCLVAAIIQGAFPLWLGVVLLLSIPVSMLFKSQTDMRGGVAVDVSGGLQLQSLVVVNLTVAVWLAWVVINQVLI